MTPPDWPTSVDYDEALETVAPLLASRVGYWHSTYNAPAMAANAARILDAIAPLIAKAVEEAEADAERLAESLAQHERHVVHGRHLRCSTCQQKERALAAHEARKAGR